MNWKKHYTGFKPGAKATLLKAWPEHSSQVLPIGTEVVIEEKASLHDGKQTWYLKGIRSVSFYEKELRLI